MPSQIPASLDLISPIQGGATLNVTVRLPQAATQNTNVQLTFSNTSVISGIVGGSGSPSFPVTVTIGSGSDHATISFSTNTVSANTNTTAIVGDVGLDLSDSSNWSDSKTALITTSGSP